jgi:hypothetical protein
VRWQELLSRRDRLLNQLRDHIERAEDEGDTARVIRLRQKRKTLRDLDTTLRDRLATLETLELLDLFTPEELSPLAA